MCQAAPWHESRFRIVGERRRELLEEFHCSSPRIYKRNRGAFNFSRFRVHSSMRIPLPFHIQMENNPVQKGRKKPDQSSLCDSAP
jgi:hypothetical protein